MLSEDVPANAFPDFSATQTALAVPPYAEHATSGILINIAIIPMAKVKSPPHFEAWLLDGSIEHALRGL
jgi:hypothetical protein